MNQKLTETKTHLNLRTSHFSSRKSLIKMKNEGVFWRSTVHACLHGDHEIF